MRFRVDEFNVSLVSSAIPHFIFTHTPCLSHESTSGGRLLWNTPPLFSVAASAVTSCTWLQLSMRLCVVWAYAPVAFTNSLKCQAPDFLHNFGHFTLPGSTMIAFNTLHGAFYRLSSFSSVRFFFCFPFALVANKNHIFMGSYTPHKSSIWQRPINEMVVLIAILRVNHKNHFYDPQNIKCRNAVMVCRSVGNKFSLMDAES